MKKQRNIKAFSHFGFSTILVTFAMICIVTFAALAFVTANSDYALSKRVATKNDNYYEAEGNAYMRLSEIDATLFDIFGKAGNATDYYTEVSNYLDSLGYGTLTTNFNEDTNTSNITSISFQFSENISDTQTLKVTINITYPVSDSSFFYEITQWQIKTDTTVDDENTLNLIG